MTGRIKSRPSATISCEECGREFQRNRKADLQRHMRIHTNEKYVLLHKFVAEV